VPCGPPAQQSVWRLGRGARAGGLEPVIARRMEDSGASSRRRAVWPSGRRRVASISAAGRRQRADLSFDYIDRSGRLCRWPGRLSSGLERVPVSLILRQSRVFLSRRPANPFYCGSGAEFRCPLRNKTRTSPIGAAPGVSVVQSFVACLRLALGHVADEVGPHAVLSYCRRGCGRWARHRSRYFFNQCAPRLPMESQMDHFVGHHQSSISSARVVSLPRRS